MSSTNPGVDPKLAKEKEELERLNAQGIEDWKETSKIFETLMKEMAKAGLSLVSGMTGQQSMTLQSQRESLMQEFAKFPMVQELQKQFLTTIFPIGGSIMNLAFNLYNAKPPIMNEKQRDELTNIGNSIASLPYKMMSGEFDLKQGYDTFIHSMNALTKFVTTPENATIAINGGLILLESVFPISKFITGAAKEIINSSLTSDNKSGLLRGLSLMAKAYDGVEKGLKKTAELKLKEMNPKP